MEILSFVILPVLIGVLLTSIITRKYKEKERFAAIKVTFLPFIEILERRKFPDRTDDTQIFNKMFSAQDSAILKTKARMNKRGRDILNPKWNEYREKREPYKNRSLQAYVGFVEQQGSNEMLNLIKEILKIVKKN